jgi:hypothetical protein
MEEAEFVVAVPVVLDPVVEDQCPSSYLVEVGNLL